MPDRQVAVTHGGQSGCILAAGLCKQAKVRLRPEHLLGGLGSAGENDGVHLRVRGQLGADRGTVTRNHL